MGAQQSTAHLLFHLNLIFHAFPSPLFCILFWSRHRSELRSGDQQAIIEKYQFKAQEREGESLYCFIHLKTPFRLPQRPSLGTWIQAKGPGRNVKQHWSLDQMQAKSAGYPAALGRGSVWLLLFTDGESALNLAHSHRAHYGNKPQFSALFTIYLFFYYALALVLNLN